MKDIYKTIVDKWVKKISKPQPYGYPICPYAANARYHIFEHEDYLSLQLKAEYFDSENYDLYICFPTNQYMDLSEAQRWEDNLNKLSKNTIIMLDHWKHPGFINGVNTGNEHRILFLIQDAKGLLKAREHLKTTSYYSNWSEDYYKKIIQTGSTTSY